MRQARPARFCWLRVSRKCVAGSEARYLHSSVPSTVHPVASGPCLALHFERKAPGYSKFPLPLKGLQICSLPVCRAHNPLVHGSSPCGPTTLKAAHCAAFSCMQEKQPHQSCSPKGAIQYSAVQRCVLGAGEYGRHHQPQSMDGGRRVEPDGSRITGAGAWSCQPAFRSEVLKRLRELGQQRWPSTPLTPGEQGEDSTVSRIGSLIGS